MTPETKMENPYIEYSKEFVDRVASGGIVMVRQPGVADRLRKYAYYLTENQKGAADALLIGDLWDAIKLLDEQ